MQNETKKTAPLVVECRQVYKKHRSAATAAVQSVCLSLSAGEVLSIVGASGSGKSTLLHVIGLLEHLDGGKLLLGGRDVSALSGDAAVAAVRRHYIAFIYQFHHLMPELTALENVELPLLVAGIKKRLATQKAAQILDDLAIGRLAAKKPDRLSGGERQRVAVARALVVDNPLILADEPTGNLDSENSRLVWDALCDAARKSNKAVLVVTHDLSAAVARSDRVLRIMDGILADTAEFYEQDP